MRSSQERVMNIYQKVAKHKANRKNKLLKQGIFISVLICIFITAIKINTDNRVEMENKSNVKITNTSKVSLPSVLLADRIPLIIYNNNQYLFDGVIDYEKTRKEAIIEKYLGRASGSLDNYREEENVLASSIAKGDVYSVNGYQEDFRICILDEENSCIIFYDNLNGSNLVNGEDLYEKLHLKDEYEYISYQLHDDYMNRQDSYREMTELSQSDIDEFIDALYESPFVKISVEEEVEIIPNYDTEGDKIAHLYFRMNDGTSIKLTLYENGYVLYGDMCRIYVYIDKNIYNKIFNFIRM